MSIIPRIIRGGGFITPKGGGATVYDAPGDQHLALATVGSGESDLWGRIEGRKAYIEVTFETGCSGDVVVAEVSPDWLGRLKVGSLVLLGLVNGDPNNSYVLGLVDLSGDGYPDKVCGLDTGAEGAADLDTDVPPMAPVPLWTWQTTRSGRIWAVETGSGGDIILHSGAGMEIKASTTSVHGRMIIGKGFDTPPVPRVAGIEDESGGEVAGSAGVPLAESLIASGTVPPYQGDQDAVVRASDRYQAAPGTDEAFFTYLTQQQAYLTLQATYITALEAALTVVLGSALLGAVEPALAGALTALQAVPPPGAPPADPPQQITSEAMSASAVLRVRDDVAE